MKGIFPKFTKDPYNGTKGEVTYNSKSRTSNDFVECWLGFHNAFFQCNILEPFVDMGVSKALWEYDFWHPLLKAKVMLL